MNGKTVVRISDTRKRSLIAGANEFQYRLSRRSDGLRYNYSLKTLSAVVDQRHDRCAGSRSCDRDAICPRLVIIITQGKGEGYLGFIFLNRLSVCSDCRKDKCDESE